MKKSKRLLLLIWCISTAPCISSFLNAKDFVLQETDKTMNADEEVVSPELVSLFRSLPVLLIGKVLRVDSVFGSDARGARHGIPFASISAALSAAVSGDTVWIFPGTYAESFTIPSGVSVLGLTATAVKITKAVSIATDLITMGENSRLENITLTLTSSSHVQLRGVVFPGTTSATSKVVNIILTVDNSTAGAGTSNVYGIHSNGTGLPGEEFSALRASTLTVNSVGAGAKRGILVDSASDFHMRDSNIAVTNNGTGSAIGAETNNASATFTTRTSTISGINTGTPSAAADISQTAGIMTVATTDLLNANANGLGFSTAVSPNIIVWADSGTLSAGTNFMQVGTASPGNQMFVRCPQSLIVKSLSVQTATAPGSTDTWTLFKNGVATTFTVALTTPATSNVNNAKSVSFATGDRISLQIVRGSAGTTQTNVTMQLY